MSKFKPVDAKLDLAALENSTLNWWKKNDIVSQYLQKNNSSKKHFSFIDGPITANGPMGVHHARGRTLKDVFQRYKNAQGFAQRFQNGFDCQGLWVEVEVEKELGFNSKKDIIDYGLDKFTQTCIARVTKFAKLQTQQSIRLGMFMDWDNSYYTMSPTNNLYIWHFLKIIHQKGWLYKKKTATVWCPRCETGLSQHEQSDGYQDITDTSVYLKFKLKNSKNKYILAWTTTPWTLSANVLLAVNTKTQYVLAKSDNQFLYLAKAAADRLGLTNHKTIDIKKLIGQEYESLYQIPVQKNVKHFIVDWDLANADEGTGIVHVAPGCGGEDFDLGNRENADILAPLDQTGHFIKGYGDLSGKYANDVATQVIKFLKDKKVLFKTEKIKHRYPHCWRCKTKCLFRLEDNWFIKCDDIKPLLKTNAKKANWIPKYVGRRIQNWLDNMGDWMISRKRFYGLALPFYQCSCGQLTVIGSQKELKKLATDPNKVDQLKSLHRPWIDKIAINCPKCGKSVNRIPEVGDCWLDAGVIPFSTLKYLEDKKYWQKWFPATFICEMIEQVRLWYYSMLFFSTVFENKPSYQNVLSYSEVKNEVGEKISKTKKNSIPFDQAVEEMGADAMRWLYCRQKSHAFVNFGPSIADQVKKDFFLILWNSYRFFITHANSQNWQPSKKPTQKTLTTMDKWILSRLSTTISQTSKHLDSYRTSEATASIESFVSDLSTWYIRRNRQRHDNLPILYTCLTTLTKLIAPIIPFFSEAIYQNLRLNDKTTPISVHLSLWPKASQKQTDFTLEKQMEQVREICRLIHAQRQIAQIKVRQPLASVTITSNLSLGKKLTQIILDETNIKQIKWVKSKSSISKIKLKTKLNPQLIKEGQYRDLVREIQKLRKNQQLNLKDHIKITAPSWPKGFKNQIMQKTVAIDIKKGASLKIQKV